MLSFNLQTSKDPPFRKRKRYTPQPQQTQMHTHTHTHTNPKFKALRFRRFRSGPLAMAANGQSCAGAVSRTRARGVQDVGGFSGFRVSAVSGFIGLLGLGLRVLV